MKAYRLGLIVLGAAALAAGCNRGGASGEGREVAAKEAAAKPDEKSAAELKWAEGVAESFLATLRTKDYPMQQTLTTEGFRSAYKDNQGVYRLNGDIWITAWEVKERTLAPGGNECRFAGSWQGYYIEPKGTRSGTFVLLVVRDDAGGKWRVNFINLAMNP
jgi:hypothetical protein